MTEPVLRLGGSMPLELRPRPLSDELELEVRWADRSAVMTRVLHRLDAAQLGAELFAWLRQSPPGRWAIANPSEALQVERALIGAYAQECFRDDCGHRMDLHGVGTRPGRDWPCSSCLCASFR